MKSLVLIKGVRDENKKIVDESERTMKVHRAVQGEDVIESTMLRGWE